LIQTANAFGSVMVDVEATRLQLFFCTLVGISEIKERSFLRGRTETVFAGLNGRPFLSWRVAALFLNHDWMQSNLLVMKAGHKHED
jgi:hypothetical protein